MNDMLSSIPWYHVSIWTVSLFALFIHAQVIVVGMFVGWDAWKGGSTKAMQDVVAIASISALFLLLQGAWVASGGVLTIEGHELDLLWKAFGAAVGVMFLRHVHVRKCFTCLQWRKEPRHDH